jgi:hypothetical protein
MLSGVDFDPVKIEAVSKLLAAVAWPAGRSGDRHPGACPN